MAEPPSLRLWVRWVVANVAAEVLGLGVDGLVGAWLISQWGEPAGARAVAFAALLVAFGTLEGVLVGLGQGWAVGPFLPELSLGAWVASTAAGAFLAWVLGMLPSTLMSLARPAATAAADGPVISDALQLLLAVPLGLVAGAVLSSVQALVLRRHLPRTWSWVAANAAAWALAMPVIFLSAGGLPEGASALALAARVLLTIAAAGAIVGAVHGTALVWMLRQRELS
jgi:hypothetical protein